jgi:polyhydroxybutyrate depolymerase
MHFHGTGDRIVPYNGPDELTPKFLSFKSVDESIQTWVRLNRCQEAPTIENLEDKVDDGTTVTRHTYRPLDGGAEVVLLQIHGGGHTWPGQPARISLIGRSTRDITANELIWQFFQRYRLP